MSPVEFFDPDHVGSIFGAAAARQPIAAPLTRAGSWPPSSMSSTSTEFVRDYGAADPRLMPAQITSFDVCNITCADVRATVHEW